jgi:asparagine synthase (glutamine-hydrolysing)
MCGICGKYSQVGVLSEEVRGMLRTITHRGPDDEGLYVNGHIGMGNRRLSIIDLAGGHQPISNEDGTVWINQNGEIYNYKHLRHELEGRGHAFRTSTDTEVIVHLYEELGERCVDRLSGMFAFAIWDERQQKLVLARDRLGQKPLFYAQDGEDFLFASEVKAILAAMKGKREIDYESVHHYLSLRFIPPPRTMLRNIKKLPPAHILVYQAGKVTISRYWNLSFRKKLDLSEAELTDRLHEKLAQTIESHLVSDVPVGAFLSGGMDSSMVVAIMARDLGASAKTFAIGVEEQDFNELPYARMIADQYDTCHVEQCVEANLIRLLPRMIWHLDEPSDPIAACQFYAAELASRHVKVVLGGDGGDELFAGFDRYLGVGYVDYYATIPALIRQKAIGPIIAGMPESFAYKSLTQKLRWIHQVSMLPNTGERYAEATCFFRFNHQNKQVLFNNGLWEQVGHLNSADVIVEQFEAADADDLLDRMLYADFMTRLPEHSLMLTDRMTMAHGLEARSPYLDHELVEFMAAFPSHLKIRNRELKYVLRKLAADYLPEQIVKREKQGFMFPVAYWFRNELYPFIHHFLLDSHFVKEGLFRQESVLRLIEDHRNNRFDNHVRLWMLLNLELWHQIYIQQHDLVSVSKRIQSYL